MKRTIIGLCIAVTLACNADPAGAGASVGSKRRPSKKTAKKQTQRLVLYSDPIPPAFEGAPKLPDVLVYADEEAFLISLREGLTVGRKPTGRALYQDGRVVMVHNYTPIIVIERKSILEDGHRTWYAKVLIKDGEWLGHTGYVWWCSLRSPPIPLAKK